jgi:hypothetical protein
MMKKPRRKIDAALKATIASEARFVVSKTSDTGEKLAVVSCVQS